MKSYFPLGKGVCLYVYPIIDTFYGASIWLVTAVAVERHINIVKRVEVYRSRSLTSANLTILLSGLFPSPLFRGLYFS